MEMVVNQNIEYYYNKLTLEQAKAEFSASTYPSIYVTDEEGGYTGKIIKKILESGELKIGKLVYNTVDDFTELETVKLGNRKLWVEFTEFG
jgi:hypothetical protein